MIDLELFPSFVNYNRTFQYHIQDNKRSDGRTFREVYPTHPNEDEHKIWAKQIQKEIEEINGNPGKQMELKQKRLSKF